MEMIFTEESLRRFVGTLRLAVPLVVRPSVIMIKTCPEKSSHTLRHCGHVGCLDRDNFRIVNYIHVYCEGDKIPTLATLDRAPLDEWKSWLYARSKALAVYVQPPESIDNNQSLPCHLMKGRLSSLSQIT